MHRARRVLALDEGTSVARTWPEGNGRARIQGPFLHKKMIDLGYFVGHTIADCSAQAAELRSSCRWHENNSDHVELVLAQVVVFRPEVR